MDDRRFDSLEALDQALAEEQHAGQGHQTRDTKAKGRILQIARAWCKGVCTLLASVLAVALILYGLSVLLRQPVEELVWVNQDRIAAEYDVIVVGAEPEGIAAAVAAARNGARTLLLERSAELGGLMTLGKLNFLDMCHGDDGTLLTQGLFKAFYDAVGGTAFDITEAKNYFLDLLTGEALLTLRTESQLIAPMLSEGKVVGVRMLEDGKVVEYTAERIVDATADGDLAALAGAPHTIGGEDIGERDRQMGVTLVFELSGVRWSRVFLHLNMQRLKGMLTGTPAGVGATEKTAWGYEQEGYAYVPQNPMTRLRGFNIARQKSGVVLINALLVFGVDPLRQDSQLAAIDSALEELNHLMPYIREHFIGFAQAELAGVASRLYVRESRHIIGEYQLSIDDVLENRDQWDKIAIGGYPADVQPSLEQPFGTVIGNPDRYAVPFRALIPLQVENLLIVGRSASYTSLAASSARVLPLGMACGQAAGVAAAQSIADGRSFREMSRDAEAIGRLQDSLRQQGAYLDDFSGEDPNMSHWAYTGMATLRRLGLMEGGYRNDYRLDEAMDKWRFQYILNGVVKKAGHSLAYIEVDDTPDCSQILAAVAAALDGAGGIDAGIQTTWARSHRETMEALQSVDLIDPTLAHYFADAGHIPLAAEVVMLLANLYKCILI